MHYLKRFRKSHQERPMSPPPRTCAMAKVKPRSMRLSLFRLKPASLLISYAPYLRACEHLRSLLRRTATPHCAAACSRACSRGQQLGHACCRRAARGSSRGHACCRRAARGSSRGMHAAGVQARGGSRGMHAAGVQARGGSRGMHAAGVQPGGSSRGMLTCHASVCKHDKQQGALTHPAAAGPSRLIWPCLVDRPG